MEIQLISLGARWDTATTVQRHTIHVTLTEPAIYAEHVHLILL